jgi:hypothetical protein
MERFCSLIGTLAILGDFAHHGDGFRRVGFGARIFGEGNQKERINPMSNDNQNRVLNRVGAHELTAEEIDRVAGAKLTFASVIITGPISNPDELLDT